jgi:carnosine N-methyltransferase
MKGHSGVQDSGLWINLGPLLYHWADAHTYLDSEEASIELSLEDVKRAAARLGFRMLRSETVEATFNENPRWCPLAFLGLLGVDVLAGRVF